MPKDKDGNDLPAGELTEIIVNGVKYAADDITRLVDTRKNLEADYTRKSQDLAGLQKFGSYLDLHPDVAKKLEEIMDAEDKGIELSVVTKESLAAAPKDKNGKDDSVVKLQAELETMKQKMTTKEQDDNLQTQIKIEQDNLVIRLDELRKTYPLMREREVLAVVSVNPQADLDELAKLSHEERTKEREDYIKGYVKAKEDSGAVIVGKGGGLQITTTEKPKTMQEAATLALKFLKQHQQE